MSRIMFAIRFFPMERLVLFLTESLFIVVCSDHMSQFLLPSSVRMHSLYDSDPATVVLKPKISCSSGRNTKHFHSLYFQSYHFLEVFFSIQVFSSFSTPFLEIFSVRTSNAYYLSIFPLNTRTQGHKDISIRPNTVIF